MTITPEMAKIISQTVLRHQLRENNADGPIDTLGIDSVESITPRDLSLKKKDVNTKSTGFGIDPALVSGLGSLLQQTAINNNGPSNDGQSILGGVLSGGAAGAALGPLGLIGGALLGGVSGYGQSSQATANYFDNKALKESFKLSSKTVSPSIFKNGGLIEGDELVPVQMELDEYYVTPEMKIYKSKATSDHKDMDKDEVTDMVKGKSFAMSKRKKFKPSDYKDELLGYGVSHYSEDGTYELGKVTMADGVGDSKKKITFSQGLKNIQNAYKTVRESDKDLDMIAKVTNEENRMARVPFVNRLIQLHEGGKKNKNNFTPQKFELGGPVMSLYENLFTELAKMEEYNLKNHETTNKDTNSLLNRISTRNGLGSLIRGFAEGLQDTQVNPALRDSTFVDGMFEELSPALSDQITSEGFSRANSLISNISNVSPKSAERIAPRLFDSALRQSNSSRLNIVNSNLNQRRGRYSFLNELGNYNRKERNRADEATRNLLNRKRANLANIGIGAIDNFNNIDAQRFSLSRKNLRQTNANQLSLLQNRMNATAMRSKLQLQRDYNNEYLNYFEKALDRNNQLDQTGLPIIPQSELDYIGTMI